MASLSLEHVSCIYRTRKGTVQAVNDLRLHAADRELIMLVGPSGCGKTTTLRLIAGLEQPSSGVIRIGDRMVNEVAPRHRDVSMVFQSYALYPHMSVYKNLAFGLKMRRVARPEIEHAVNQVAGKLGLSTLLDRKPHQLSGGERQRVALGRAIVRKPQLFLLDEPLSNLDVSMRANTRAEIKTLQRELATTMVYVTHDQEDAMTLADKIGVLNHGKLQQFGPPLEIYNRPANRFVAGFFGSPPMNLLTGEIKMENGQGIFASGQVRIPVGKLSWLHEAGSKQVVLGIRPHEIVLNTTSSPYAVGANVCINGTVRRVEPLGDSVVLRVDLNNGTHVLAKTVTNSTWHAGQALGVGLPLGRLHFFDANEAGKRLN